MGFLSEVKSFIPPSSLDIAPTPAVGNEAPAAAELLLEKQATVLAFLRHCGCPATEKTFIRLNAIARQQPEVKFIAISHSDRPSTTRWLASLELKGSSNEPSSGQKMTAPSDIITSPSTPLPKNLFLITDPDRRLYSQYGLGLCNTWHIFSPSGIAATIKIVREEGIGAKPTESGSRWQTAGGFAIDQQGKITWAWVANRADDVQDFEKAVATLKK